MIKTSVEVWVGNLVIGKAGFIDDFWGGVAIFEPIEFERKPSSWTGSRDFIIPCTNLELRAIMALFDYFTLLLPPHL